MTSAKLKYRIMRRLSIASLLVVWLASSPGIIAQEQLTLTMPDALPSLYNPAKAGATEWLRVAGAARFLQKGDPKAPYSFAGAADMPLNPAGINAGAGIALDKRSFGLFSYLTADLQASYRFRLRSGTLSLGIAAGLADMKLKTPQTQAETGNPQPGPDFRSPTSDGESPAAGMPQTDSRKKFDVGIGASFASPSFHASLSALHLTSPSLAIGYLPDVGFDSVRASGRVRPTLYFATGGNIGLGNPLFLLQASLLAAISPAHSAVDLQLGTRYRNSLYLGLGYRWNQSVFIRAEASFSNFFIGYSFGYPVTAAAKEMSFRHEIAAGYRVRVDFSGVRKHKQRSIRIM